MKNNKRMTISIFLFCVGSVSLFCSIFLELNFPDWRLVHEPLHSTLEGLGAFAAICIAPLILMMRESWGLRIHSVWLASGLIGMGVLDGFHAVHPAGNEFVWLHSVATFIGGILFAAIWLPSRMADVRIMEKIPFIVLIASLVVGACSVTGTPPVPIMIQEETFSEVARALNILGGIGFLGAAIYFFDKYEAMGPGKSMLLATHALLFGIAALLFEFSVLWDAMWWFWHGLRITAYLVATYFIFNSLQVMKRTLLESKERFQALVETTSDWIWELDRDANFTYASPRVKTLLGYEPESLVGKSGYDLMPPEEAEKISRRFETFVAKNEPFTNLENINIRADGTRVVLESSGLPFFDENGALVGYRGADRDVTGRKKMEKQLIEAKNAAERANKDKSRFLAAASHDLRQPIHAMRLFAATLRMSLKDHENVSTVRKLEQSIDTLGGLLNALLDISKLDAGVIIANYSNFPILKILQNVENNCVDQAKRKGLRLTIVPSALYVHSDPVLLQQIVDNLVSNSVRYTSEGRILVGCRRQGSIARIDVIDTGHGIAPDDQEIIFDEFIQLENSARQRKLGVGLGLAIVKRNADLLGHRIDVWSAKGTGTRFSVEVPFTRLTADEDLVVRDSNNPNRSATGQIVLVVEDDPAVLEATESLLTAWGYRVIPAQSFDTVKRVLDELQSVPDLLIVDFNLPGSKNGLDVYREISAYAEGQVPTIIISGDTSIERVQDFEKAGLNHMSKPINPVEFKKQLDILVN